MTITWLNENTAIINGGGECEFVGIIRGEGNRPIRYKAPKIEDLLDGLVLDEWIYVVRKNGKTVLTSRKSA